jgi:photosystem II stability/assembly factor-like uncharacterized protein
MNKSIKFSIIYLILWNFRDMKYKQMKKYLSIHLILLSFSLLGQEKGSSNYCFDSYIFTNLGEEVSDLFIDPEIEGRLVAATSSYSDEGVKISTDSGLTWTPSIINTSVSPRYIRAISTSFNPSNLEVGYLAARFDLFKTTDRGETWDSTNMFEHFNDIYYVVYHPLDSNIVFVSNFFPNYNEVLLYKSVDGGTNWTVSDSIHYTKLIFHPDNPNIIYGVAFHSFIKKTVDGGNNWVNTNNNLGFSINKVRILELRKNNPDVLYCGQINIPYDSDNWLLSMTTDGGDSWVRIDSTLKQIDSTGSVYSISLDQNMEGRFYVSYTGGLFLTEDNGKHFQKIYSGSAGKIWSDNNTPSNIYFNSDKGLLKFQDTFTVDIRKNENNIPTKYKLNQNYPNPFNPTTIINYSIPNRENVTIKIFDTLGGEIVTLVNEIKIPGEYEVEFDASKFSSGVYFYSLKTAEYFKVRKMILLR